MIIYRRELSGQPRHGELTGNLQTKCRQTYAVGRSPIIDRSASNAKPS